MLRRGATTVLGIEFNEEFVYFCCDERSSPLTESVLLLLLLDIADFNSNGEGLLLSSSSSVIVPSYESVISSELSPLYRSVIFSEPLLRVRVDLV